MKRLVFCFDGTWNQLSAANPTNVVITAQSVTPVTPEAVQIIHYDSGVGTGAHDRWSGGLFGDGLIDKVVDAYTFLVFNYEPGDELFVFGFSRGAFTARSFVGFVRNLGIVQRKHAVRITEAVTLYKARDAAAGHNTDALLDFRWRYSPEICVDPDEDAWRDRNCEGYATGMGLILRVKYVGVWDTVAAMGLPADIVFAKVANRGEEYFDSDLSSMVVCGRHAVSIDESRTAFKPTLWPNFRALNASLGYETAAADAPYQQKWFPGDHGSVGGGGDIRGLSDRALIWVLDGAEKMGLVMDKDVGSPLYSVLPDDMAPLRNVTVTGKTLLSRVEGAVMTRVPRSGGPTTIDEVSDSALRRWRTPEGQLPEGKPYRPKALDAAAAAIGSAGLPSSPQAQQQGGTAPAAARPNKGALYKIVYGDTLGAIAVEVYGHIDHVSTIVQANPTIDDPDRIFVGQVIFLPL